MQKNFTRTKNTNSTKKYKLETSDFHFDADKKHKKHKIHKKAQNVKQVIFFPLDVFYAHKNVVFLFLHKRKAKKAQETQKGEKYKKITKRKQATFS